MSKFMLCRYSVPSILRVRTKFMENDSTNDANDSVIFVSSYRLEQTVRRRLGHEGFREIPQAQAQGPTTCIDSWLCLQKLQYYFLLYQTRLYSLFLQLVVLLLFARAQIFYLLFLLPIHQICRNPQTALC